MKDKEQIINKFHEIKELGYVKSKRRHNTGIGKTFEDYIGVKENNRSTSDWLGYEIKAHRELSKSYITLFTKSPSFPKGANTFLKERFGTKYEDFPDVKNLHTSMFANKSNSYKGKYAFRLYNDKEYKRVYIAVYSMRTKKIVDVSCYYTYEDIEIAIENKLKKLFYVAAKVKQDIKGKESFWFYRADIYEQPTLDRFINLLDEGIIMYDIRIGSYKSGINYGKTHDHGSCFRIMESDLTKLYSIHETVD